MDILTKLGIRYWGVMIFIALALLGPGLFMVQKMPVDVLPELSSPSVTILTEAHQMGPEAVELQISLPLETALQGLSHLRRLRSASGVGLSMVVAEFDWQISEKEARLQVMERLQTVAASLPEGIDAPLMTPPSSIMGEIIFLGITDNQGQDLVRARQFADTVLRPRLLAVSGVSQITVLGSGDRAIQIELLPNMLQHYQIKAQEIIEKVQEADGSATAGYMTQGAQAFLVRSLGRSTTVKHFENLGIGEGLKLKDVARVTYSQTRPIGLGSVATKPAIILAIGRQPQANTIEVSEAVDKSLKLLQMPEGLELNTNLFRQEHFIRAALNSLKSALAEGSFLVVLIVILGLQSLRSSLICLLALPLSLVMALLILSFFGVSINTMTLGGLTIAIGALVDDAIVFVENTVRRLNEGGTGQDRGELIAKSLSQVASSIIYATAIIVVVFLPLFFLSGIEGKLFQPLGLSYVTALVASLFVALFLTPAFIYCMGLREKSHSTPIAARLAQRVYDPVLKFTMKYPVPILVAGLLLSLGSVFYVSNLGTSFLPPFREGSLTIEMSTIPGTSLQESDRLGRMAESVLLGLDGVLQVARRSGRASNDAHAVDETMTEIEVVLDLNNQNRDSILESIRNSLKSVSGVVFNIGQPISHRIDHILSGARAMLVVAVFGEDLIRLDAFANRVKATLEDLPSLVDVALESQGEQPELRIVPHLSRLADYGLSPHDMAEHTELLFDGIRVAQILQGNLKIPVIVRYEEGGRQTEDLKNFPIVTERGSTTLSELADVSWHRGPNRIGREDRSRRILVMANIAGMDLGSASEMVEAALMKLTAEPGIHWQLRGQFEARKIAAQRMFFASFLSLFIVGWILHVSLGSLRLALLTMLSLPLSLAGGAFGVYYSGGIVSLASLVGFLTLLGIAARNGILLLERFRDGVTSGMSHYDAVWEGTRERLLPVFMTAISTALGLLPLVLAMDKPGNEIQAPMAAVILGGLISSTVLSVIVVPALWLVFHKGETK
ncbi:MAG: efflux RND transporter permease subunit [Candidatus Cloacimonetes bacterium]|nr:efflux RND transporter permease subunit [Candidatus Cloacimonadota bacterium]